MAWKRVCSTGDVAPQALAAFEIDGIEIVVANLGDAGFSVFPPACPHMEEPLAQSGMCAGNKLTCSKHLWQWNMLTGEPEGPGENERSLLRYEAKVEGDAVLAQIDGELVYEREEEDGDDDFEW